MISIKYLGHSCFLIDTGSYSILFDPFISHNDLAKSIDITTLKPNYILLSHGHADHTADAYEIAMQSGSTIVSNFEIVTWFEKKGVINTHPMNIGGVWQFPFGNVTMVQAVHSSSLPDGSYGGNPAGFILEIQNKTFYYAGDTALTWDMKLLGEKYKIDAAFLPLGDNFTMGLDDAIKASEFIHCKTIIGMHYDTFGYIKLDHAKANYSFAEKGLLLHLLKIGSSIQFN